MLDGHLLVDAHVHVPVLGSLARRGSRGRATSGPTASSRTSGTPTACPGLTGSTSCSRSRASTRRCCSASTAPRRPATSASRTCCRSSSTTRRRFRPVANVNPHLHFPIADEVRRQLDLGAAALKLHPVHGGFRCDDAALYPAYQVLAERGVPLVVHCGTSSFPGSMNELADPEYLLPVVRDFPTLDVVLAHGGRGWWYDAAAFMALREPDRVDRAVRAAARSGCRSTTRRFDLGRLARKWIFATDWPGVPSTAENARAVVGLGLDDERAADVLGGNALRVYSGLGEMS